MHAVSQDGLERENHISFEVAELSISGPVSMSVL